MTSVTKSPAFDRLGSDSSLDQSTTCTCTLSPPSTLPQPPNYTWTGTQTANNAVSMNGNKRSRAKHACKECNLRRVRCDVMLKHPCSNCAASHADCLILPSRRGRYPRKPRQSDLGNPKHDPAADTPSSPPEPTPEPTPLSPRDSVPPSISASSDAAAPTAAVADTAAAAGGGGGEGGGGGGGGTGSLFFGESNFLTLVSSGRSGAVPAADKSRLSFPINPALTPQADHQSPPSTGIIHLSHGTERYLRDENALTFPSLPACLSVIQAYFTWFHPCFPVLDRPDIARRLPTMDISPILFQSILFIGATYCDEPAIVAMGFRDRTEAKSLLYTRARLLFHADSEKDQITLVQSLFLMSFWRGESSDVRDVRYWLGVTITLAETCGLHRSTKLTTRDLRMARMRRRLWWSVYVRERQSAASLGLPMRIRDEDCDIEPLTVADLEDDRDESPLTDLGSPTSEHLVYPVKMVELARLLGKIIDLHFVPGRTPTAHEEVVHLRETLEEWKDSLPIGSRRITEEDNPSIWSCLLHLAYNQLRILLFRNGFLCHDTHDTQAALGAASQVSRIAETMLERKTLQVGHAPLHIRPLTCFLSTAKCISSRVYSRHCVSMQSTSRRPMAWEGD